MANPFSKTRLNKLYDKYRKEVKEGKMTEAEFAKQAKIMAASYQANKGKTKPATKAKDKAEAKPKTETKPKADTKPKTDTKTGTGRSGVTGQYRKKGDPGPAVVKKGSRTGASVDPRERQLRKNRQEAKRGSTAKGRANIKAQVDAVSGSSRRNQRQVEERRRRARRQAMLKNRRQLLARRNNDM